jgi:hypothetical protein
MDKGLTKSMARQVLLDQWTASGSEASTSLNSIHRDTDLLSVNDEMDDSCFIPTLRVFQQIVSGRTPADEMALLEKPDVSTANNAVDHSVVKTASTENDACDLPGGETELHSSNSIVSPKSKEVSFDSQSSSAVNIKKDSTSANRGELLPSSDTPYSVNGNHDNFKGEADVGAASRGTEEASPSDQQSRYSNVQAAEETNHFQNQGTISQRTGDDEHAEFSESSESQDVDPADSKSYNEGDSHLSAIPAETSPIEGEEAYIFDAQARDLQRLLLDDISTPAVIQVHAECKLNFELVSY